MPLAPETLVRHELAGLRVEVVDAPNPDLVGIAGRVVRETMRTLVIEATGSDASGSERMVPKRGTTFEFALPADAAPDRERAAYVTVDGARLLSRPARRTETGGTPTWR